jgi:hypothetical protein
VNEAESAAVITSGAVTSTSHVRPADDTGRNRGSGVDYLARSEVVQLSAGRNALVPNPDSGRTHREGNETVLLALSEASPVPLSAGETAPC